MLRSSWVGGEFSEKVGIGKELSEAKAVATGSIRVVCCAQRKKRQKRPDDGFKSGSRPRPFASWTSLSPFLRAGLSSSLRPSSYATMASSYCLEPWRAAPFRA